MKIREFTFVPEDKENPIKVVYEDDFKVIQTGDYTIETVRKLTPMESEKLLNDMFGSTDIAALDCSDISDEEIYRIVDEFNSIGCTSFQFTANELKKILERQENEMEDT